MLRVSVVPCRTPRLELLFTLDDSTWLLNALQNCVRLLPQP